MTHVWICFLFLKKEILNIEITWWEGYTKWTSSLFEGVRNLHKQAIQSRSFLYLNVAWQYWNLLCKKIERRTQWKTGKHFFNQIITTVKENNYIDHKKIATRNQLAQINNQASLRNNNLYAMLFQCSCGNTHTRTRMQHEQTNKHIEKNFKMKLKKIRWRKKLFETKKNHQQ